MSLVVPIRRTGWRRDVQRCQKPSKQPALSAEHSSVFGSVVVDPRCAIVAIAADLEPARATYVRVRKDKNASKDGLAQTSLSFVRLGAGCGPSLISLLGRPYELLPMRRQSLQRGPSSAREKEGLGCPHIEDIERGTGGYIPVDDFHRQHGTGGLGAEDDIERDT